MSTVLVAVMYADISPSTLSEAVAPASVYVAPWFTATGLLPSKVITGAWVSVFRMFISSCRPSIKDCSWAIIWSRYCLFTNSSFVVNRWSKYLLLIASCSAEGSATFLIWLFSALTVPFNSIPVSVGLVWTGLTIIVPDIEVSVQPLPVVVTV